MKEKKSEKPHSIKFSPSVEDVINKLAYSEERSLSYIVEREVKESLKAKGLLKA